MCRALPLLLVAPAAAFDDRDISPFTACHVRR
jgi:hypothetical protein